MDTAMFFSFAVGFLLGVLVVTAAVVVLDLMQEDDT